MKKLFIIILITHFCCHVLAEEDNESDDSGSGLEGGGDSIVNVENTESSKEIHKRLKSDIPGKMYMKRSTEYQGTEKVVLLHSVASKFASHSSDTVTNHDGTLLTNLMPDKTAAVTKRTQLSNITSSSADTSTKTKQSQVTRKSTMSDDSGNESAGQGTGSEVQSIGPMEGIEIKVNGSTSTFNNFTQTHKESELTSPDKLRVLHFLKDYAKVDVNKKYLIKGKKNKKSSKKKKAGKKAKKYNKSKKSRIFPKIIVYQGPISKALESILKVQSSPFTSHVINAPMSFEEATRDIKRNNIAHVNLRKIRTKLHDEEGEDYDEDNDYDVEDDTAGKKSKVIAKQPRKYVVKGFNESGKPDKKSLSQKVSKGEIGKKKMSVVVIPKRPKKLTKKIEDEQGFPAFPKANQQAEKQSKNYNPFNVPNDEEPSSDQFNDFIKQMVMPISTPDTPFFTSPEFEYHVKTNKHANNQQSSIIGNTPKSSGIIMERSSDGTSNKISNKEIQVDGYEFEYPNPAGYPNSGDEENDEPDVIASNATSGTHPIVIQAPLQQHPQLANNPSGLQPVNNSPDVNNNNIGQTMNPQPVQLSQTTHLIQNHNPQGPEAAEDEEEKPEFPMAPASPDVTNTRPDNPARPNLIDDLLERVQANSHEIDAIGNEVRDVESRLEELGSTISHLEKDLQRMEKNVEATKSANVKLPSPNFELIKPATTIPIKVITGGNIPVKLLPRIIKKPRIIKQFFIPLPPPNSHAIQDIEQGAPVPGLPYPLNEVVSFLLRKVKKYNDGNIAGPIPQPLPIRVRAEKLRPPLWHYPPTLPDIALPPREHDLDRLELELGRVPINRMNKKPKIILFSKTPNIVDLTEKPCDEPCRNGGECIGGNVCKCPPMFTGVKCESRTHRLSVPGDIMGLLGPLPTFDDEFDQPRKSNTISLPLVLTESNDDEEGKQRTIGQVDQSKLVDILSTFAKPEFSEFKRK